MKTSLTILLLFLMQFSVNHLSAQSYQNENSGLPLKQENSILFGKDIVIHNQPDRDQRNIAICSAFNGWLFSVYTYIDQINNMPAFTIMKSIDNGISWTVFYDIPWPNAGYMFTSMNIVTIGDSISNLKIIIAGVNTSGTYDMGEAVVFKFNGATGDFEDKLLDETSVYNIVLATDYNSPANGSNPASLGILYSKWTNNKDSIIFRTSSNGGITLDNMRNISVSANRYHKVALAYGRSSTYSNGNYYAAWEEHANFGLTPGHIYTAHTYPNFNSDFTKPVNLDSLDPVNINLCRNPSLACQYNNIDNDSSDLTQIVLFDKYDPSSQKYDITGYYNLQATNHSNFKKLNLSNSAHYNCQPSINFNPFDSTFMVTYHDSTTQKLPFLLNNFNLVNPGNWQFVSTGYNDSANLAIPFPKVEINEIQYKGVNVWTAERSNGNGVAMLDTPYSTWTGFPQTKYSDVTRIISVYPNPCNQTLTIDFELSKSENVKVELMNLVGQPLTNHTFPSCPSGKNQLKIDVTKYSAGLYILTIHAGDSFSSEKISVTR